MLPYSSSVDLSLGMTLGIALALGVGFGFLLERAGFGSARKLVAVFYGYDMAVLKVMFTAIVTAMVGLFVLSEAGALDVAEIYMPPTHFAAQIVGGLVFGVGFVMGGYCPGTSVAAAATGRVDGLVFALGILGGIVVYSEFMPGIEVWVRETARDDLTLPGISGIGTGWYVLGFVGLLGLAAWGARGIERRFARLRPGAES